MTIDPAKPDCKATADAVAVTPEEFAGRTRTDSRYLREWLADEGTWLIGEPFAHARPAAETPFNIVPEARA